MTVSVLTDTDLDALRNRLAALEQFVISDTSSNAALAARVKALEAKVPTPPVVVPPVVVPPVVTPPASSGTYPIDGTDKRLTKSLVSTGEPSNYGSISNAKITGREGPRISGAKTVLDTLYIEIAGILEDHGDGIQGYDPGAQTDVLITKVHVKMLPGSNNCGLFIADNLNAKQVVLQDVLIEGGKNCPNGGIWFPNRAGDTAVQAVSYTNVDVDYVARGVMGLDYAGGLKPKILAWSNVRTKDSNGNWVQVPRPY